LRGARASSIRFDRVLNSARYRQPIFRPMQSKPPPTGRLANNCYFFAKVDSVVACLLVVVKLLRGCGR
jgi:hypothetical protein